MRYGGRLKVARMVPGFGPAWADSWVKTEGRVRRALDSLVLTSLVMCAVKSGGFRTTDDLVSRAVAIYPIDWAFDGNRHVRPSIARRLTRCCRV